MLWDDEIELTAVGYQSPDPSAAKSESALVRERTQTGDTVVRARVVTVTSDLGSNGEGWRIGFRTMETLAGRRADPTFSFVIDRKDPAAVVMSMLDSRLVGSTFVVFVRDFDRDTGAGGSAKAKGIARVVGVVGVAGRPARHFHIARDDKDELGAVRDAALLLEVAPASAPAEAGDAAPGP
jgi:hypothetical protein